jgi:hypothetical protein
MSCVANPDLSELDEAALLGDLAADFGGTSSPSRPS